MCITLTKQRISAPADVLTIISVKKVESWFLADSTTLSSIFRQNFRFKNPENEEIPFFTLKQLFLEKTLRGIGESKSRFAKRMILNGFSIVNAADHGNCSAAKYLLNKISSLN